MNNEFKNIYETQTAIHLILSIFSVVMVDENELRWSMEEMSTFGGITIRPHKEKGESIMVELLSGDISIVVNRHEDIIGHYLGIYLARTGGFSVETTGILGKKENLVA